MGYYISNLKELPKIFNWHLFLIGGNDYHFRAATHFFQREFVNFARDLGEDSAIIAGDQLTNDLNELLQYDYELFESLWNVQLTHSGLLMMDSTAMRFLVSKRDSYLSDTMGDIPNSKGSIYFIPYLSLEYAYYSESEMYADIMRFVNGSSKALIHKTESVTKRIAKGEIVDEFNRHWYRPIARSPFGSMTIDDHDALLARTIMISLQSFSTNTKYLHFLEDDLNDILRDHLKVSPYWIISDQTRQGYSANGTSSGELDILISDENRMDIAIIEALRTKYLNKQYINDHLSKLIHNYDPLGVPIYNLIIYSSSPSFTTFWNRALDFLRNESLPNLLEEINHSMNQSRYTITESLHEEEIQYPNLHHAKAILRRNGWPAYLHIYAVNISDAQS